MTKAALVTGASSGIGEAISISLLNEGYEVFGIGRSFSSCTISDPMFHPVCMDLLDTSNLLEYVKTLPADRLDLLINNAGAAWYGPHETLSPIMIQTMTRTNLEVPFLLSNALLRTLKKNHGMIINISSVTALSASPHGAVYGSLKAGLLHFSRTLFEEHRKSGLRVCTIMPDMTDSGLYRNADFGPDLTEGAFLLPEDTASAVISLLHQRPGSVITEVVLRPQFHRITKKSR